MIWNLWYRWMSWAGVLFVGMVIGARSVMDRPVPTSLTTWFAWSAFAVLIAWIGRTLTFEEAQDPKARLKSGRWTVITVVERYPNGYLLALKRHVAFGYWAYRLADIPHGILTGPVVKSDGIVVSRKGLKYVVEPA